MKDLSIDQGTPFFPAFTALEVTRKCNLRCLHCGSSATGETAEKELTLAQWKDVVDQLVELKCQNITLSGGEPFVWPHWRALAQHIVDKNTELSVITNGVCITKDDARFLKELGARSIGISIDGLEETHNHIRQNKNCFARIQESIGYLKEEGLVVSIITSVNQLNFAELESLHAFLTKLGVAAWQLQTVNAFGRAGELKDSLILQPQQYVELIHFVHKLQIEKNGSMKVFPADSLGYCDGPAEEIWGDLDWGGCNAGLYVLGIQSNGDVMGCLSLQSDVFRSAGNVLEQPLAQIWANDEGFAYNRNFQKSDLKGSCAQCDHGEQCRSGCLGMGYSVSGEMHHNPYCYSAITKGEKRG